MSKTKPSIADATRIKAHRRRFRAAAVGLLAAGAVLLVLPASVYHSEAVVGIGDPATPLRDAMTDAAVAVAVSNPVIMQAAASLVGTAIDVPTPDALDKIWVGIGIERANSREARLATLIAGSVRARADATGIVKVSATASTAGAAAQIATAVAESLVADRDHAISDSRRRHELRAAQALEDAKAAAQAARRKFLALGGTDLDPAQVVAAAAAQTEAAQARLDVVKSILAGGTPPLSDRHDLPQTIAALQTSYVDLSQQLATARETLGDRHTTVVSLREGVKRAAANLTAEWKRVAKIAQADVAAAKDREAAARQVKAPTDPAKLAAIDEARQAARVAEDVAKRAETRRPETFGDDHDYRLVASAPVPIVAAGLPWPLRLVLSAFAGLLAFAAVRSLAERRFAMPKLAAPRAVRTVAEPMLVAAEPVSTPLRVPPAVVCSTPKADTGAAPKPEPVTPIVTAGPVVPKSTRTPEIEAASVPTPKLAASEAFRASMQRVSTRDRREARFEPPVVAPVTERFIDDRDPDRALHGAMEDLLPAITSIDTQNDVPTVLVAANEAGSGTTPVALALAEAAAASGQRVLVVEGWGARAALAATTVADAEPVLIDVFGTLRIALRAEGSDGLVTLAPALRDADRLVAGLARSPDVPLVDDLMAVFDLIVVDGGEATARDGLAEVADAVLRVGTHPSDRDDERLLARIGVPRRAFLGTVAASAFIPRQEVDPPSFVEVPRPTARASGSQWTRHPLRPPMDASVQSSAIGRRKIGGRR